jgi:folate-dependent phosphoribosylglycinamide formyltransferase PurN
MPERFAQETDAEPPASRCNEGPRVVILTKRSVMSSGPFVESLIRNCNVRAAFAEDRITVTGRSKTRYVINRLREQGLRRLVRLSVQTLRTRYLKQECAESVVAKYPHVPYHAVRNVNESSVVARIRAYSPDIICVGSTRLLEDEVLRIPPLGCLNIHGSMLPRNAGLEPTFWALYLEELDAVGETIHFCVPDADAGDIVLQERIPFAPGETVVAIDDRIIRRGAQMICEAVKLVGAGRAHPMVMDLSRRTYRGRPTLEQRRELDAKIMRWRQEFGRGGMQPRLWTPEATASFHEGQQRGQNG